MPEKYKAHNGGGYAAGYGGHGGQGGQQSGYQGGQQQGYQGGQQQQQQQDPNAELEAEVKKYLPKVLRALRGCCVVM